MSGAIASYICVPTDLMKVRLQLDGMKPGSVKTLPYIGSGLLMRWALLLAVVVNGPN